MDTIQTASSLYRYIKKHYSHPNHLNYQENDEWVPTSTEEFMSQVKYIALGIRSLGVKKGDMVGILANTSSRWVIADLAIMCAGAVAVPIFSNISKKNFKYEIEFTEMKFIFVSGEDQWKMCDTYSDHFSKSVALYEGGENSNSLSYKELISIGEEIDKSNPDLFEKILDEVSPDDMASIIFTSGTTGLPKGAQFSHKGVFGQVGDTRFELDGNKDIYLSPLPLAHIFARNVNSVMLGWGVPTYFLKDITTLADACKTIRPTISIFVPRILEKIYAKMIDKVENDSPVKRAIGKWAFKLAISHHDSFWKRLMFPIADVLVFSKIREAIGGRFKAIASGGAKLNPMLHRFFIGVGIPIYEGWGLTEGGLVCSQKKDWVKFGTVGIPFDRFSVKISEEGEVLVKGPAVMQGYYKNEEATAKAFTEDGWLKTGDKGEVDDEGYLTIYGRLGEMYKTSTGEWVVPVPIEQELMRDDLVDIAMVIGEGRNYASCLLFPDFEVVNRLKRKEKMQHLSDEEFFESKFVKKKIDKLIKRVNKDLDAWQKIREYRFATAVPSVDGEELTPTLKLRRDVIREKYHDLIESMYQ